MSAAFGAFSYLAPLEGRGRILRVAKNPGEGDSPRVLLCGESPSPQPSPPQAARGSPSHRVWTVIARLDRATQYAAAFRSSFRGAPARTWNLAATCSHITSRFRIGPLCGPSGMTEKHKC